MPRISRLLSNLNPKGRNKIEIREERTDHLTSAASHTCFSSALCTKLPGQKKVEKTANIKSCAEEAICDIQQHILLVSHTRE